MNLIKTIRFPKSSFLAAQSSLEQITLWFAKLFNSCPAQFGKNQLIWIYFGLQKFQCYPKLLPVPDFHMPFYTLLWCWHPKTSSLQYSTTFVLFILRIAGRASRCLQFACN